MKYLILFLLSFNCFANFAKLTEVNSFDVKTVYSKMGKCGSDCVKLPKEYNSNFHITEDEMVNDTNQELKDVTDIDTCSDVDDCDTQLALKVCIAEDYFARVSYIDFEVSCVKHLGYVQVLSGRKIVVEDAIKKAAHEVAQTEKEANKQAKKDKFSNSKSLLSKLNGNGKLTDDEIKTLLLGIMEKLE